MNAAPLRKVALALSSMHPSDRRWLLGRLPRRWRGQLRSMMTEARAIGATAPDLIAAALDDDLCPASADMPVPTLLIAALDGLSDAWATRMLSSLDTTSAELYLANCHPDRAQVVRAGIAALPGPCPPALADALAAHLKLASEALAESMVAA